MIASFDSWSPTRLHPVPLPLQKDIKELGDQSQARDTQKHPQASPDRWDNGVDVVQVKLLGDDFQVRGETNVSDPLVRKVLA